MIDITSRYGKDGRIKSCSIHITDDSETIQNITGITSRQLLTSIERFTDKISMGDYNGNITLTDFIPIYLETAKNILSPLTYQYYKNNIDRLIIPELGNIKLKDITSAHIQEFVNKLSVLPKKTQNNKDSNEVISSSSVRRYITVLQSIFKQAVKQNLICENPASMSHITVPKINPVKVEIFTRQEAAEMLHCLKQENLQFQTLIQLAVFTGARRGELVGLKFSDIDFEQHKLTIERSAYKIVGQPLAVKPPKDYEIRTIALNNTCCELLKMLQKEKETERQLLGNAWIDEDWVFTQWNGAMMNPMTPTKQFSKFLSKHGLKHRRFHSLRHTSATLLLYAGVDINNVKGRLGHGDIKTTSKYLHMLEEADAEAAYKLENLLFSELQN